MLAEGLLDFESSITKELELSALLGKNINLNKARELAFNNDIEGATKEVLRQIGGQDRIRKNELLPKKGDFNRFNGCISTTTSENGCQSR